MDRRLAAVDRSLYGLGLGDVAGNGFELAVDAERRERGPHALG
ncbi:MAG: hypothetical protein WD670_00655 [Actinomycetota bacterium]